jgi:hypothetical protein
MPSALGLHTCVACEWNSKRSTVIRWWNQDEWEWRYCRRCSWCGSVFPATKAEYENQEQPYLSPWATRTPTRQPADTETEWTDLDLSWWNGTQGERYIADVKGKTWKCKRLAFDWYGPWTRVKLNAVHTAKEA